LIHRDIKPSNIIFVGGVLKLADVLVTAIGEGLKFGTAGFIPPEGPAIPPAISLAWAKSSTIVGQAEADFPDLPTSEDTSLPPCVVIKSY
jgi:serine/threonine protein kinase